MALNAKNRGGLEKTMRGVEDMWWGYEDSERATGGLKSKNNRERIKRGNVQHNIIIIILKFVCENITIDFNNEY